MKVLNYLKIACVMATVSIGAQLATFSPAASAKHFVSRKLTAPSSTMPHETNFMRFKKAESLWTVLEDSEVRDLMKSVMGTAVQKYNDVTQLTEMPTVEGTELYSSGGVSGLYTILESFFDLDLASKKLCVVILNDKDLDIYGSKSFETMPIAARQYVEGLQTLLAERQEKLNIQFKPADTIPVEIAKKAEPKKNLKVGVVTGTYSRVDTDSHFESADFKVQRLAGNKIKFCCTAFNGSHSGWASAVVPISNNLAEYDFDLESGHGYKLSMAFDGKYVYVNQEGDGFGGIGVTACGKYEKMDDRTPQIEAE